jgi:hypothetical protein
MTEPEAPAPKLTARQRYEGSRYVYRILGVIAVALLALGTVSFHFLEDWSWVDSFYFSVVAGTTVGFGDLAPTSDASKLFSVFYIFASIGILGTFLDNRLKYHGVVKRKTAAAIHEVANKDQT